MRYLQLFVIFALLLWVSGCFQKPTPEENVNPEPQNEEQIQEDPSLPVEESNEADTEVDTEVENTDPTSEWEVSGDISIEEWTQDEQEIIEEYEMELESLFNDILGESAQ